MSMNLFAFWSGGSQGPRHQSDILEMLEEHPELQSQIEVLHQTGRLDYEAIAERYDVLDASNYRCEKFIDAMAERYQWSDIVVCGGYNNRAQCLWAAAILIPFPYAVDDHQTANARALEVEELQSISLEELIQGFFWDTSRSS